MPGADATRALVFLHVPKAGGTALAGALGNRFAAERCLEVYYAADPDDAELNAARYVTGHVSMSVLDRFERPPLTLTVLREPIERALSIYSFFRELDQPRTPRLGLQRNDAALRLAKQHPLDEFIEAAPEIAEHYLGNWQARMLGAKRLDRTDERLDDALEGLHRCDFVGLAERQDDSVDRLTRRLGWAPLTPLPLTNVTRTRLRREQVPEAAMEALLELTAIDRELYAEAVQLYEERGEESGEDRPGEIEDAPLVSDLRFAHPIRGAGWLGREGAEEGAPFCWVGHTARAHVDLAGDPAARSLVVEIVHAVEPAILETLRIAVDGEPLPVSFAEADGAAVASVPLGRGARRRNGPVRVELAVDRAARPCDIHPESDDSRELAIAVRRIALVSRAAA